MISRPNPLFGKSISFSQWVFFGEEIDILMLWKIHNDSLHDENASENIITQTTHYVLVKQLHSYQATNPLLEYFFGNIGSSLSAPSGKIGTFFFIILLCLLLVSSFYTSTK